MPLRFSCVLISLFSLLPGGVLHAKPDVYVWQRQWTPAVVASLEAIGSEVDCVQVLAAEVNWRAGRAETVRVAVDSAALKKLGLRVGLVVRIGAYGGAFSGDDAVAGLMRELVAERVKVAREAGVDPVEVQIDFDCAETKLAGYREWLRAVRASVGTARLVFTALPAWLKHEEAFRALAGEVDGFVLQVHSLEKPREGSEKLVLCDDAKARGWMAQAAGVGVSFRVALPTYGYEVGFGADGKFIGLAAEGPRRNWPEGTRVRVVEADALAMQALRREIEETPPKNCGGVVWFRLPVEGDRLNWDVRTLLAVMRGGSLAGEVRGCVEWSAAEPGLAEVFLENAGTLVRPLPRVVAVSWAGGERAVAADALGSYAVRLSAGASAARFVLSEANEAGGLRPGRRVRVGWMRFSHELSLQLTLSGETALP